MAKGGSTGTELAHREAWEGSARNGRRGKARLAPSTHGPPAPSPTQAMSFASFGHPWPPSWNRPPRLRGRAMAAPSGTLGSCPGRPMSVRAGGCWRRADRGKVNHGGWGSRNRSWRRPARPGDRPSGQLLIGRDQKPGWGVTYNRPRARHCHGKWLGVSGPRGERCRSRHGRGSGPGP